MTIYLCEHFHLIKCELWMHIITNTHIIHTVHVYFSHFHHYTLSYTYHHHTVGIVKCEKKINMQSINKLVGKDIKIENQFKYRANASVLTPQLTWNSKWTFYGATIKWLVRPTLVILPCLLSTILAITLHFLRFPLDFFIIILVRWQNQYTIISTVQWNDTCKMVHVKIVHNAHKLTMHFLREKLISIYCHRVWSTDHHIFIDWL